MSEEKANQAIFTTKVHLDRIKLQKFELFLIDIPTGGHVHSNHIQSSANFSGVKFKLRYAMFIDDEILYSNLIYFDSNW